MKKSAVIGISLLAALAVVAYVFLATHPAGPEAPAESAPAQERVSSGGLPDAESAGGAEESDRRRRLAGEERPPGRASDKKGAKTSFALSHGEIGYVDVNSVVQDRDPYSVVALLQNYQDLTGADESLEIEIPFVNENELWGYEATFTQLIGGSPTQWVGKIFFSSSGAVARVNGDLVNPQALSTGSVIVLRAEAEAIALEATVRYAAKLPVIPELRGQPLSIEVFPEERYREMRYELDRNNELRNVWRIPVSVSGSKHDSVEVLISAETGEVMRVRSAIMH